MLFNFNMKNSFTKFTNRHTHTHVFSLTIGHNGSYLVLKGKKKTIIITYHTVPHSACLPVIFFTPELVTTTRTTSEVAP